MAKFKSSVIAGADYARFISALKSRIQAARLSASRVVYREMILLYWDIGHSIVEKQRSLGWGESVVEQTSKDLRRAFPGMTGLSTRNLWDMKRFYLTYADEAIWQQAVAKLGGKQVSAFWRQAVAKLDGRRVSAFLRQAVAEIPWGQNLHILNKVAEPVARLYYIQATARFGWSRSVLLNQIKAGAYERAVLEKKTHNFPLALPEHLAGQADPIGVAEYHLQAELPPELKGKLPTARQLLAIVRPILPPE